MNIKNGLICLLIIAILIAWVPSVAAASTSKLATGTHNKYSTDVRCQQARLAPPPVGSINLFITITNQNGHSLSTTSVNHQVFIGGCLFQQGLIPGVPIYIGNAYVDIQVQNPDSTQTTLYTATTGTAGSTFGTGCFQVQWTPNTTGVFNIRAYYDGNGQYTSAVSNVEQLTVVNSGQ